MENNFKNKITKIKALFTDESTDKEKYELILDLGRSLPPLKLEAKTNQNRVEGCQSTTYLTGQYIKGEMHFQAESDALISAGLAALLLKIYDQESPKTILQNPPDFLKEVNLHNILSPLRASSIGQMYQKMCFLAKDYLNKKT